MAVVPSTLPLGATPVGESVTFRVWAPARRRVRVALQSEAGHSSLVSLSRDQDGYHLGVAANLKHGARYHYLLDDDPTPYPDPVSRFQPQGPMGPSEIVDLTRFEWTDQQWKGIEPSHQVLYEMHIGTFTKEGVWDAASAHLEDLASIGVTTLEVMPIAEFFGSFGWGYDGVHLFAPSHLYGRPEDVQAFVNRAHSLGLGVVLDVVYNHWGPVGNSLDQFSTTYRAHQHKTDWGAAVNFDSEGGEGVREYVLANVDHWIRDYHFDGLRVDATQNIHDNSTPHILAELSVRARNAAGRRSILIVGENEPQNSRLLAPVDHGGMGFDMLWNDDFHHSASVALTGRAEAYYSDYRGSPQEMISAAKRGFLFQGQWHDWQKQGRGTPTRGIPDRAFVTFLENHDQVANSARGQRLHQRTSPGRYRAMTLFFLLMPGTPMLFQGQEDGSAKPFRYFAEMTDDVNRLVQQGRIDFLTQFASMADPESHAIVPKPSEESCFRSCQLDRSERDEHLVALHREALTLRREDPVLSGRTREGFDGAVLAHEAFALRFFGEAGDDRLLLVNFGVDLSLTPCPEPLIAPPGERAWKVLLSTEAVRFGGHGTPTIVPAKGPLCLPGQSAALLTHAGKPPEPPREGEPS